VAVEVGGLTAGTEFDWIDVTGTATVAGTIQATLTNGFTPTSSGTRFPFVTGTSVGGTFTTTDLPANFAMVYPGASAGLEFSATGGITCSGTICWDGGAGTNLWTDAANWTSDRLPDAGDIVVINLGGTNSVLLNSGDHTVGSITVTDPFEISSASLVVDGPADFLNTLTISEASRLQLDGPTRIQTLTMLASTLTGAGAVRVLGAADLVSSALSGNGTLTTEGATTLTDNGVTIDGRRWINAGTVMHTGDAQIGFANGAVIENTGTWTLSGASTDPLALLAGSGNRFINSGQFVKSAGGVSTINLGGTFDSAAGATTQDRRRDAARGLGRHRRRHLDRGRRRRRALRRRRAHLLGDVRHHRRRDGGVRAGHGHAGRQLRHRDHRHHGDRRRPGRLQSGPRSSASRAASRCRRARWAAPPTWRSTVVSISAPAPSRAAEASRPPV
jgi:hypothetical protein